MSSETHIAPFHKEPVRLKIVGQASTSSQTSKYPKCPKLDNAHNTGIDFFLKSGSYTGAMVYTATDWSEQKYDIGLPDYLADDCRKAFVGEEKICRTQGYHILKRGEPDRISQKIRSLFSDPDGPCNFVASGPFDFSQMPNLNREHLQIVYNTLEDDLPNINLLIPVNEESGDGCLLILQKILHAPEFFLSTSSTDVLELYISKTKLEQNEIIPQLFNIFKTFRECHYLFDPRLILPGPNAESPNPL